LLLFARVPFVLEFERENKTLLVYWPEAAVKPFYVR